MKFIKIISSKIINIIIIRIIRKNNIQYISTIMIIVII